jgi:hypothetical protein
LHVWGTKNHSTLGHKRDSAKVKIYCAMSQSQVDGRETVNGINYQDMLQN